MLGTKITEIGKLKYLDDGGLICSVTVDQRPSLDETIRVASFLSASADQGNLAIGDLVVHYQHGVARYCGHKTIDQGDGEKDYLLLEFAGEGQLFVPPTRSELMQKLAKEANCAPSTLNAKGGKWPLSYYIEVLPNAYEWPGIGTFPLLPPDANAWDYYPDFARLERSYVYADRERSRAEKARQQATNKWRRACTSYQKALHADPNYQQAAHEYFEGQNREPQALLGWWVYRAMVLRGGSGDLDESRLLTKQYVLRREQKLEKIRREVESLEKCGTVESAVREPIPESVRLFVWRRDKGQCVRCGSRELLEFDHIIPVVAGGSNTARNLQLLCEPCNRSKGATV